MRMKGKNIPTSFGKTNAHLEKKYEPEAVMQKTNKTKPKKKRKK